MTLENDKKPVFLKIKAYGKFARLLIEESQPAARIKIKGNIQEELKRWDDPKSGYRTVIILSMKYDDCSIEFISGAISQIGDQGDLDFDFKRNDN